MTPLNCWKARPTSASRSCPTTVRGWWWPRWWCIGTWYVIEKTGAYLRAGTENLRLVEALAQRAGNGDTDLCLWCCPWPPLPVGVGRAQNVPGHAARGQNPIMWCFAVVVIGGMGPSWLHPHRAGLGGHRRFHQGVLPRRRLPPWCFVIMVIVLPIRPAGLFGWPSQGCQHEFREHCHHWLRPAVAGPHCRTFRCVSRLVMNSRALHCLLPAFNLLLLGYTGLVVVRPCRLPGGAAYVAGHAIKVWGPTPEVGLLLAPPVRCWVCAWLAGHLPPGHLLP